jgi:aryl-alcohol dehydrogenase-like predicted oxidoreductase
MTKQPHEIFNGIELGIGTWAWGDRLIWHYGKEYNDNDIVDSFRVAVANGIRFFDTAEIYGQGKSESFLGEMMQDLEEPVIVATKMMPYPWRLGRDVLQRRLAASLNRLKLAKVQLYQIHWPLPPVSVQTWMERMVDVQEKGLVEAIGVSNYDLDQTLEANEVLEKHGSRLTSNQVEYHLLERRNEKNGLMEKCNELGIRIIAYSPLAMGVLTGKYTPENPPVGVRSSHYNREFLAKIQPLLKVMKKIGNDHEGKSAAQVAINWVICKGALPIPGGKNATQVEQNIGAMGWRLTPDEVQHLDELSDLVTKKDE